MKKSVVSYSLILLLLLLGFAFLPQNTYAQSTDAPEYVPNRIIVKYKSGQSKAKISQIVTEREAQRKTFFGRAQQAVADSIAKLKGESLPEEKLNRIQNAEKKFGVSTKRLSKFKPDDELTLAESTAAIDVPKAVEEFKKLPEVEYAEPDFLAHAVETIPNDPDFDLKQWGPQKIQAPKAWDIATGSANLIISVVDTGVKLNHPDLAGKIIPGYDFYNNDSDPSDDYGHGTHVAGIIAAVTNNSVGMAGIAWQGKILPVKVCSSLGSCPYSTIGDGIQYAADNGAKIINISLGGYSESQYMKSKIDYAYGKNVLIVAAAGNDGNTNINYPAKYANVVAVGATNNDASDTRAWFSNYGTELDIVAPGVNIWSTVTTSGSLADPTGYRNLSGTSMATPHVAGAAALLLAKYPNLLAGTYNSSNQYDAMPGTLAYYLYHGVEDRGAAGRDDTYGWGRLNIYNSLLLPQVTPTPTYSTPTPIPTSAPTPPPPISLTPTSLPTPTRIPTPTLIPNTLTINYSFSPQPTSGQWNIAVFFYQGESVVKRVDSLRSSFTWDINISDIPLGTYDIVLITDRHLSRKKSGVELKAGVNYLTFDQPLLAGNIDSGLGKFGDDQINLLDYNRIMTEWSLVGNYVSDLNYDGGVGYGDYIYLKRNYNQYGE